MDAQIELLEGVLWGYVSPLALGAALFVVGLGGASRGTALGLAVVAGVSAAVWLLNRRAVRRGLRPRRDEVARRLRRLERGEQDRSAGPGPGEGGAGVETGR